MLLGVLEVREGVTSEGKLLEGSDSYATYTELEEQGSLGFNSGKGLYIRLEVENMKTNPQRLQFVYGIFKKAKKSDGSKSWSDAICI